MSQAPATEPLQRAAPVKRVVLATLMGIATLNIFTGGPLLGLWLGSLAQGSGGQPTVFPIVVVALTIAVVGFLLVKLLQLLGNAYDRAAGRTSRGREQAPWMRSLRGERGLYPGEKPDLSALERILVVTVVLVFLAFEIWFLFYAGSSIDTRSGRGQAAPPPVVATF